MHLLFGLSRTMTIAQVTEKVKTSTSKWLKATGPGCESFSWQAGYGAFSVGVGEIDACVGYIRGQAEHHRKVSFQDEYRELLRVAGVEFDERYVWDLIGDLGVPFGRVCLPFAEAIGFGD